MTIEQLIDESEFTTITPAGGNVYYNKEKDAVLVVYPKKTRIYTMRIEGIVGKKPVCFKSCRDVDTPQGCWKNEKNKRI